MRRAPLSWPRGALQGFGRFWWKFLIGDTPEIFLGVVVVLGVVAVLSEVETWNLCVLVVFPVLIALLLAGSLARVLRRN
jgi:hypothetical protein